MDDQLSWHQHTDYLIKKLNPRMYCLRKLFKFNVNKDILRMFYESVIVGVWNYCICAWGGNVRLYDAKRIDSVTSKARRLVGTCKSFNNIYNDAVQSKFHKIWKDNTHPLHNIFAAAESERSGRMRLPQSVTNRHSSSFSQ